jgi:uncharacterized membrane protein
VLNPLALPIHPILVHFSIAMLTAGWVCLIIRYSSGDIRWEDRWRMFELVGVFTLAPTIVSAFIDTRGFGFLIHPRTGAPLIWHMTSGLVTAAAFSGHYVWRRRVAPDGTTTSLVAWDLAIATFAMIALVASGLIAGELVYGS